jgi:hypothetical protein
LERSSSEYYQAASNILMIRPAAFSFNPQTAGTNFFQDANLADDQVSSQALSEFDETVKTLWENDINVFVFEDTSFPLKPDAVFPNNWITFHENGTVIFYPMCTPNRRTERRHDIIDKLKSTFEINNIVDVSHFENEMIFLEGSGSMAFDHQHKKVYACISARTNINLLSTVAAKLNYEVIAFNAIDDKGNEIYHTNVMMNISKNFAVVCTESISNKTEQALVTDSLKKTGHEIIEISFDQMKKFAGNMISVKSSGNEMIYVLSENAYNILTAMQINKIEQFCKLLVIKIGTIEAAGGGSIRCMMAEIFCRPLNDAAYTI